ncbi:MAG: YcaO-like family protein [Elusimicrobia bacterium]|nr:YcaO-like family protein [Elusimicrobiota bacterium]
MLLVLQHRSYLLRQGSIAEIAAGWSGRGTARAVRAAEAILGRPLSASRPVPGRGGVRFQDAFAFLFWLARDPAAALAGAATVTVGMGERDVAFAAGLARYAAAGLCAAVPADAYDLLRRAQEDPRPRLWAEADAGERREAVRTTWSGIRTFFTRGRTGATARPDDDPVPPVAVTDMTPSGPGIPYRAAYAAYPPSPDGILFQDGKPLSAGFDVADPAAARVRAEAEAVERGASQYLDGDRERRGRLSADEAALANAVAGAAVFRAGGLLPVYPATGLGSAAGRRVRFPSDLVLYPGTGRAGYQATSSGVAAGRDWASAATGALLELTERDSLMLAWASREPLPRFVPRGEAARLAASLAARFGGELTVLDATRGKGIPHVLAVLRTGDGRVWSGAAAHFCAERAALKALSEVAGSIAFVGRPPRDMTDEGEVRSVSDHADWYSQRGRASHLDAMLAGPRSDGPEDAAGSTVPWLVERLETAVGGSYYLADLTTAYAAARGITVVRALSTDLVPIWFGSGAVLPVDKRRLGVRPAFLHFFN